MTLKEIVEALQANSIEVAVDLGIHESCLLESNCPEAVKLRLILARSGLNLESFGKAKEGETYLTGDSLQFGKLLVHDTVIEIGGSSLKLNLSAFIKEQAKEKLTQHLREISRALEVLKQQGQALYRDYERKVLRAQHTLPQTEYPIRSLIEQKCRITSDGKSYEYIFPFTYAPEYLVTKGDKYCISPEHKEALKQECFISFFISKEAKILSAKILNSSGKGFSHYHGRENWDCWGFIKLPEVWDRQLESLRTVAYQLSLALMTINLDSVIPNAVVSIPIKTLRKEATLLGREGIPNITPVKEGTDVTSMATPVAQGRNWGERNG